MADLRRRRRAAAQPIAARLRDLVLALWTLLLLVSVTAVGVLQIEGNQVDHLRRA